MHSRDNLLFGSPKTSNPCLFHIVIVLKAHYIYSTLLFSIKPFATFTTPFLKCLLQRRCLSLYWNFCSWFKQELEWRYQFVKSPIAKEFFRCLWQITTSISLLEVLTANLITMGSHSKYVWLSLLNCSFVFLTFPL